MKRTDFKLENVAHVVTACVVLHNICELCCDSCPEEWRDLSSTSSPATSTCTSSTTSQNVTVAATIRDAIARHISGI